MKNKINKNKNYNKYSTSVKITPVGSKTTINPADFHCMDKKTQFVCMYVCVLQKNEMQKGLEWH